MSKRSPVLFLTDMLESLNKIQKYIATTLSFSDFTDNDLVVDAVLRNLEIIGVAAKMIPDELKSSHPEIPWKCIIGLRNIVAHGYFIVDLDCVEDSNRTIATTRAKVKGYACKLSPIVCRCIDNINSMAQSFCMI